LRAHELVVHVDTHRCRARVTEGDVFHASRRLLTPDAALSMWDPLIVSGNPQLTRLQRDLDTLFSDRQVQGTTRATAFFPEFDVMENDRTINITADLPGVKVHRPAAAWRDTDRHTQPADLTVEVRNNILTLSGKKCQCNNFTTKNEGDTQTHCIERRYERATVEFFNENLRSARSFGAFQRSFMLPENTREDQVNANLAEGVLHVTVQKPNAKEMKQAVKRIKVSSTK
jgi:HSP20 family protein